ncbi:MAG: outer membrane protein assembly factor BamE, partial [Acidiferrobacterales bacterium]
MTKSLLGILSVLLTLWLVTACFNIYRPEVQQGNVVTQEMVSQLKIGMSRRQVRFLLGTPLIEDPFHQDRWDY